MMATLSSVSWQSVVRGMDEGFRGTINKPSEIEDRDTFQVLSNCWRLFQLQQSFCAAGFTIARPIALGLIGVNLFSKGFIQTLLYGYKPDNYKPRTTFTQAALWLQDKIDPEARYNLTTSSEHGRTLFYWSNYVTDITPYLLKAADLCEGFLQLEKNWTQGAAKIATMSALFWSNLLKSAGKSQDFRDITDCPEVYPSSLVFLRNYSHGILDLFVRINVKICAIYQNSILSNCINTFTNIAHTAARHISSRNYREILNTDSANITNTLNVLNHVYEIVQTFAGNKRGEVLFSNPVDMSGDDSD